MADIDSLRPCRKCGSDPYIILDRVHVECKECFLESCNRKLRSTIGKSYLVRNNDAILVAYSGGQSSTALLDMIGTSIKSDSRREQRMRPSILHIDMQSCTQSSASLAEIRNDREIQLKLILEHLKVSYPDWPIYWSTIETCMTLPGASKCYSTYKSNDSLHSAQSLLLSNEDAHFRFHEAVSQQGDLTDRQKFITDKCTDLIDRVAEAINSDLENPDDKFTHVFTGSSATQLANNLLVDVILGQGSTIRSTVNICDKRPPVPVMRPMRDFSKKEVVFYLRARGVSAALVQPNLLTKSGCKSSIQTVTETFLSKLYVDYPATYNTLLKTGNKMRD